MSEEGSGNGQGTGGEEARAKRVLTEISSRAWEHPADRAALQALRRIPVFDDVLRSMFGFFGEKPIRLAFQANAVKVSAKQFPRLHSLYQDVCKTLDPEGEYDLFVSQTPIVNAGAYGMDQPFIILNSGTIWLLERRGALLHPRPRARTHHERPRSLPDDDGPPDPTGEHGLPGRGTGGPGRAGRPPRVVPKERALQRPGRVS